MITTLGKIMTVMLGIAIIALIVSDIHALLIMKSFVWFAILTVVVCMTSFAFAVMCETSFMKSCPLTLPK